MRLSLLLLLIPLGAGAGAPQDLDGAFRQAEELAAAGDWAGARAALKEALEPVSARGEVLKRLPEIRRRLADWSFGAAHPDPGPGDLLHGKVVKYKPGKRLVKVRYDWAHLPAEERNLDFSRRKSEWLFDLPLEGDLKISLRGRWPEQLQPVTIVLGYREESDAGLRVTPGFVREKNSPVIRMPLRVERFGEPVEVLERTMDDLEEAEGSWAYTVEARRGSISLRRGSKRSGEWTTAHPELLAGRVGFSAPGLERVEIEGTLQKAPWADFRKRALDHLREHYRSFEYDLQADLPGWLADLRTAANAAAPLRPPPGAAAGAVEAWAALTGERPGDFDFEKWADGAGLTGGAREYARAADLARQGAWARCGSACAAARAAGLESGALEALSAQARFFRGERTEAILDLDQAMERFPQDAGFARIGLAGRLWGAEHMLQACDEALAAGAVADRSFQLRQRLGRALRGPVGPASARYRKGHVLALSDAPEEQLKPLVDAAADWFELMLPHMSPFQAPRDPLLVLHFSGEDARKAFCTGLGLPADTRGYVPELHLSIWVQDPGSRPDGRLWGMLWDQFCDASLPLAGLPAWFRAGTREFFVNSHAGGKDLRFVPSPRACRRMLKNQDGLGFAPADLLVLPAAGWEESDGLAEAESWLFVHFVRMNWTDEIRYSMGACLGALLAGKDAREVFDAAFADLDAAALRAGQAEHRTKQIQDWQQNSGG